MVLKELPVTVKKETKDNIHHYNNETYYQVEAAGTLCSGDTGNFKIFVKIKLYQSKFLQ